MVVEMASPIEIHAARKPDFSSFIGNSAAMGSIFQTITRLLDNDSTVLILGESGTGKGLVARAIHENSTRRYKPMVTVNCGAIPEELLESELFGHEKGAFTGAIRTRIGKFELADNGTIFLDEIGDMSMNLQVKLLRVLQEQEFERIGAHKTMKVNVRVVAATNQNLDKAIAERRFREDLFYRFNVIPIHVPALRERAEDVPHLAMHFVRKFNRAKNRDVKGITPESLNIMRSYGWPGNVRELEHLMERIVVLKGEGYIEKDDLPPKLRESAPIEDIQLISDMLLVGEPDELAKHGITERTQLLNERLFDTATEAPVMETPAPSSASAGKIPRHPANDEPDDGDDDRIMPTLIEGVAAISAVDLHTAILPEAGINLKDAVDKYETTLILAALERCDWVKNRAATLLGLNRTTLVEKLKKKNLLNGLKGESAA